MIETPQSLQVLCPPRTTPGEMGRLGKRLWGPRNVRLMEKRTGLSHRHRAAAGREGEGEHAAHGSLNLTLGPISPMAGSALECGFM